MIYDQLPYIFKQGTKFRLTVEKTREVTLVIFIDFRGAIGLGYNSEIQYVL